MLKIRLFCGAGMSSSLLATRTREAGEAMGYEVDLIAYPVSHIKQSTPEQLADIDAALLGPQVAFEKNELAPKFEAAGVPFEVIPMRAYGTMDGPAVFKLALEMIEKKKAAQ